MSSKIEQKRLQRLAKQWNVVNTTTIIEWISASNLNILLLNTYLISLRSVLRFNTLWSLVISSVTSTISVTQFTVDESSNLYLSYGIKILIFLTSVATSLITGYIKVEKIQETIELLEEHKKNWLSLMYSLTSELQVGMEFRNDATAIINAKKDEFNVVSARQIEIPQYVHQKVSSFLITKRIVENRIKKVQEQKNEDYQQIQRATCGVPSCIPQCFTVCCCFYWFTYCFKSRCCDKTENDYNMEKIATKLSLFHTINKEMTNELLELMNIFKDEVKGLQFDRRNDMFNYEIINNRYTIDLEANEKDISIVRLKNDSDGDGGPIQERRISISHDDVIPIILTAKESKQRRLRKQQKSKRQLMESVLKQQKVPSSPYKPLNKRYDITTTVVPQSQNRLEKIQSYSIDSPASVSSSASPKSLQRESPPPSTFVLPSSPETNITTFSN